MTGATIADAQRIGGQSDRWEISVEPDGEADVRLALDAARECGTPGALCTSDERALSTPLEATVPGPGPPTGTTPFTARFANVPAEHDGETPFTV